MNKVTVTIVGPAGAGKSAIARLIELALLNQSIIVERVDDNGIGIQDEREGVIEATLDQRTAALATRTAVTVRTELSRRETEPELSRGLIAHIPTMQDLTLASQKLIAMGLRLGRTVRVAIVPGKL